MSITFEYIYESYSTDSQEATDRDRQHDKIEFINTFQLHRKLLKGSLFF